MADVRLKISPPWVTYINKLTALFDGDPQIAFNVNLSAAAPKVVISTNNGDKATALRKVLPEEKVFGNIKLVIEIDGKFTNKAFKTKKELMETLFYKNPAFVECFAPAEDGYWFPDFCYVCFKNCVVQFFNDNLNDPRGLISTLYQDIAHEIFIDNPELFNVYCATDVEVGKLGKPLGEWP